jgi:hypothetical protein
MTDPYIKIQSLIQENKGIEALSLIEDIDWPNTLSIQKHSWKAQAHLIVKQPKPALDEIIYAIRIAKKEGNDKAYKALKKLQEEATSLSIAQKALQNKKPPTDPLGKAIVLFETDPQTAIHQLTELKTTADNRNDSKNRVLTRLALAHHLPVQSLMLEEARSIADSEGDHNLITAVKKTLRQLNIPIQPHIF